MKSWSLFILLLVIAACTERTPPPAVDAAGGPCSMAGALGASGAWLIGRWTMPLHTLDIRRDGDGLRWDWEREPGVHSQIWGGDKAPARVTGHVVSVSGCAAELRGYYVWSSSGPIVGRAMTLKPTLIHPRGMRGQMLGAGGVWLDTAWRRAD